MNTELDQLHRNADFQEWIKDPITQKCVSAMLDILEAGAPAANVRADNADRELGHIAGYERCRALMTKALIPKPKTRKQQRKVQTATQLIAQEFAAPIPPLRPGHV